MKATNFFLTLVFFLGLSLLNTDPVFSQDQETRPDPNCLCQDLEEGTTDFNFENGTVSIDGHSLVLEVNGETRTFTFGFNLADALCSVGEGQILAEFVEENGSIEIEDNSLDLYSHNDISITLNSDYLSPRLILSFSSHEVVGEGLNEISIILSIDPETCTFEIYAAIENEITEQSEALADLRELAESFSHFTFEDMDQGTWALAVGIVSDLIDHQNNDASNDFATIKRSFLNALKHFVEVAYKDGANGTFAAVLDSLNSAIEDGDLDAVALALAMLATHV